MSQDLIDRIVSLLAPNGCMDRSEAEAGYPPRALTEGALVTRLAPSPTGFVHIGTVYTALINERLAHQSNGLFLLRIEDTDKSREVEGGRDLILNALQQFALAPDEGPGAGGIYGPYVQSERLPLYTSFAINLLKNGRAYACFATAEELASQIEKQKTDGVRPGYYGQYAIWRDKPEELVRQALDENRPFILRFRSSGDPDRRVMFQDWLKGSIELPQNDLDIPLLKSDGFPTYHLAHVVDDHLMKVNLVLRGDEWLSSVPLHIDLCQALKLPQFHYGHIAPISILDNGAKRKLSKRKDAEADIRYWLSAGYPVAAIKEYLLGLANSNFEDWRRQNPDQPADNFQLSVKKLAHSRGPLLDVNKLEDVSRDVIAKMEQADFEQQIMSWVNQNDYELAETFADDAGYTSRVLKIERDGPKPRKDIAKWSQARDTYAYFFDKFYEQTKEAAITNELANFDFLVQKAVTDNFLNKLDFGQDQPGWLAGMRAAAQESGFAADMGEFKKNPAAFAGSIADFAKIIRVRLTGKNQTPDLYSVIQTLGEQRVRQRLSM